MQTRGTFPDLNSGMRNKPMKPASNTNATTRALTRAGAPYTEAPPKRRRQLTAPVQDTGNPFAKLQALVGNALKGRGSF